MFDGRWRTSVERVTIPVGKDVEPNRRVRRPPHRNGARLCRGRHRRGWLRALGIGAGLFIAAALPDLFDGAVAKASGSASPRGAFFDSVADRVTDMAILGGIAFFLAGRDGGRAALLPMAAMAVATLVVLRAGAAPSRLATSPRAG